MENPERKKVRQNLSNAGKPRRSLLRRKITIGLRFKRRYRAR